MIGKKKMSPLARGILEGLDSALAHAEGRPTSGTIEHVILVPDVIAIRRKLHLSQEEFAQRYRIPLLTLRNWELGRRLPDAPAAAYLHVIAKCPREISEALKL